LPTLNEQIAAAGRRILELSEPHSRIGDGQDPKHHLRAQRNAPEIAALTKFIRTRNPADLPPGFVVPAAVQPIKPPATHTSWK
jgi:hypothetical protein